MDQPRWLVRSLEVYSRATEEFLTEHQLPPVALETLQSLWGRPPTDPMLELFELTSDQCDAIESLLCINLDLVKHTYFLAAHSVDTEAAHADGGLLGRFAPPRELPAFPEAQRALPKTREQ